VICYARLSTDGNELVSTGVRVGTRGRASLGVEKHVRINREARDAFIGRFAKAVGTVRRVRGDRGSGQIAPASGAVIGDVEGLVILVDFVTSQARCRGTISTTCSTRSASRAYGNNGSVRDYFYDVSNGNLTYTNWMPPVIIVRDILSLTTTTCHGGGPPGRSS